MLILRIGGAILLNKSYRLPDYSMVAGETQNITILLYTTKNRQLDATGMYARFAVTDFINQDSEPILTKVCTIITPQDEYPAVLNCRLTPDDTIDLGGKYIYQITVMDIDDSVAILKGDMLIDRNCDREALYR